MAQLIEVFSGKTKGYCEDGVCFKTAIVKTARHGEIRVNRAGIEGNETANHKNALYAVSRESYAYWQAHSPLNISWQAGLLGENLSIIGLDESELLIGDLLHIGQVVLQVSGCRTPCANLLWRLNAPESFLAEFQKSGQSGFYLEVIETGTIRPGDPIEHQRTDDASISVADLALFFMEPEPDQHELRRLVQVPGMGQQMLSMLTALLNTQRERELIFQHRWNGWKAFRISKLATEACQIKSFYLTPCPDDGHDAGKAVNHEENPAVAGYRAGQYLTVKVKNDSGEELIRCWSISDYDEELQQYRISIKREPKGNASRCIHDLYKVGDRVEIMPPMGQFTLKRNDIAVPVILISAGIGITPMVSMLKSHAMRLDKRLPTLYFIHSTQNAQTHAFKTEVTNIIEAHENFHQHIIYTRADTTSNLGIDYQQNTRLSLDSLNDILANIGCWFAQKWIPVAPFECHYYLCGPESFIRDTKKLLRALAVPDQAIFDESFSAPLVIDHDKERVAAKVGFLTSQQQAVWQPERPQTLLELAEANGLTPSFSCRNGHCGLCATKKINGDIDYLVNPATEIAEQNVLLCCAIPSGDVELDL